MANLSISLPDELVEYLGEVEDKNRFIASILQQWRQQLNRYRSLGLDRSFFSIIQNTRVGIKRVNLRKKIPNHRDGWR